jgi:hypothetical protein
MIKSMTAAGPPAVVASGAHGELTGLTGVLYDDGIFAGML